jgi:signal transduction histidine kinase
LKKNDLIEFISQVSKAVEILERNLNTTANLVTKFKEVAVDQSNEEKRPFALRNIVDNHCTMLHPTLKKFNKIKVVNNIPEGLMLTSYAGAIGQVTTNLVMNSVIHGFSNDTNSEGSIEINAEEQEVDAVKGIVISFTDTGRGIDPKIIGRVFDPFFTTKMGSGGTGLGLSIVMNIVNNILGGTISVSSTDKTTFTIWIPQK